MHMFDGLYSYYEDIHSPILPLLRCLNIPHIIRLISALLSKQKVILVSKNITKLSFCVRGAAAILEQGLLIWRHIQIPVLPPHLFKYLASETSYLIGVLATIRNRLQVDQIPGIQDVFCIDLDIDEMSTIIMVNPKYSIPDLLLIQQNRKSIDLSKNLAKDLSTIRKADQTCENERGEELYRSSPVCLFLEMYGDMGMYLSVSKEDKKFWMDRKKLLLRKKQLGEEGTPIF